jgi:acetyltransferase-like isoleucine patch superfamily enzyme
LPVKAKWLLGDNFHSGEDCLMITENHNYDKGKAIPYDDTYIIKDIYIEDNVCLGTRVIIFRWGDYRRRIYNPSGECSCF